jgi:methionyl-tRNA formyltransferase
MKLSKEDKDMMQRDQLPITTNVKLITLFLMTEKGHAVLTKIVKKYKPLLELVVIGSDKALKKDFEEEIINVCIIENINYIKQADFTKTKSEYALAVSWRWMIKHPVEKLIIFHDSLLPKYRGFAPLVNALINGEKEIGVSALFGANEFDTGNIIYQSKTKITYPITINEAIQINNKNYIKCAEEVLRRIFKGESIEGVKQDESKATYSVWRDDDDYEIDWSDSAPNIRKMVDALGSPYEGAKTKIDGKLIRIIQVEVYPDVIIANRHCGKVIFIDDGKPVVICGQGLIKITVANLAEAGETINFFPLSKFRIRFQKK